MEIEAVDRFQGAFLDIFMSAMHRIARLEANYALPTPLSECPARLGGCKTIIGKGLLLQGNYTHRATKQHITLLIDYFHAWMGLICGAIYFAGLELFVIA